MATKTANGNGISPSRPPFRRQGSSVAAGTPHPLTIALNPAPKIDYSVTKGGARTWAVLLVFMFLCSSLYTVFSAKEMGEMPDLDGDGTPDYDDDISDEVTAQQRKTMKDTTPSSDEHRAPDKNAHDHHVHQSIETADDEEDSDGEDELEATLFAGLRKKIENNIKKVQKLVKEKQEDKQEKEEEEEEEEERAQVKQRPRRRKNRKGRDAEEDEEEEEEKPLPKKEKKRLERQRKREEEERRKEEERQREEEKDEEEEEEEKEEEKEEEDEVIEHNKEEEDDDNDDDEKEEEKEEEDGEKDYDDDEDEDIAMQPQRKSRKRHATRQKPSPPAGQECRRKHCPPADTAQPRKSLLKNRRPLPKHYQPLSPSDLDAFDDDVTDDDVDDDDDEEEHLAPVQELVAVKKYRSSGREAYKRHAITNRDDHRHRETLDKADFLVEKHDYTTALALFDSVLKVLPFSPRAHFGKARAYDIQAEYTAEEKYVDLAISEYEKVTDNEDTPDALFRQAATRLIEGARFRGHLHKCLQAHRTLIDRFPKEMGLHTDFGLTFLMMKRHDDARKIFKDVLEVDPNNAIALAYYGYLLKVVDNDMEGGVAYMRKGLKSGGDQIADAKFYYHFGHALMYLGRTAEAYSVYEQGAELGLFLSAQQRSMYNIEGLTGRPWWSLDQTGYTKHLKSLERQWVSIRHESVRALIDAPDQWEDENEEITVDGHWLSYSLFRNGHFVEKNCRRTPLTCAILKEFKENSNCSKSDMYLSVLSSGAQVLSHCGPSNTRLQAHMGLVVPSEARIRVGPEQRGWKTGKFVIFDDSFEHEMHFDGASSSAFRLVLVVDLWHPEVSARQRAETEED